MTASLSVITAAGAAPPSCVQDATTLCARTWELTGSAWLATNADAMIATPARILVILVVAVVTRALLHRAIRRLTERTATGTVPPLLRPLRARVAAAAGTDGSALLVARRGQRAAAIGSVLRSFSSFVVLGVAVVLVLGQLGIDLAPIVASAGVVGVALGFGAQNLVKDFIAGIGIILEDQYGVGDVVDLGEASGTVEAVGLRITRLRDAHGVVWYARNGEILRVGNKSQGYAQVVIDMPVAHDTDLEHCRAVMQEVAETMRAEEEWAPEVLAEPESLGAEDVTAQGVVMRLQVRTTSTAQWRVGRELRMRLAERLAAEGIRTPSPVLAAAGAAGADRR
jgi:moderate conductance mechanosensitive channel